MSRTKNRAARHKDDFYETPAWCVHHLAPVLREICPAPAAVIEPGAGHGAIVKMLQEIYPVDTPEITAIDKRPKARYHLKKAGADAIHIVNDYLTFSPRKGRRSRWDLALGNPPYSSAMPFIKKTLELAPIVVFLLRLGFLCSQGRSSWLRANTPTIIPLSKRPSFTGNGTDRYDYAWFVWGDPRGPRIVMRKVDDVSAS